MEKIVPLRGNLLDLLNGSPSSLPRARDAMREGSTGAEAPTLARLDNYFGLGSLFFLDRRACLEQGRPSHRPWLVYRWVGAPTSSVSPQAGA